MPRNDLIQLRRGTAAGWTAENPTLESGEFGYETDTRKLKIGPGQWSALTYLGGTATATAGTPASASASGQAGEIRYDASFVYVAVAANTWRRAALATW